MSSAEQIRMCLAEAGFIEGRDYLRIEGLQSDGYIIFTVPGKLVPGLKEAIDKARELVGLYTCGGDPKERKAV